MSQLTKSPFGEANVNKSATIASAKDFLRDYGFWRLQEIRIKQVEDLNYKKLPTLSMPSEQAAKITLECSLRLHTIRAMQADGNADTRLLADILELRYIKKLTVTQARLQLSISERSFARRQNDALLAFAFACPYNLVTTK